MLITIYNGVSCLSIQAIPHMLKTTVAYMFVRTACDVEGLTPRTSTASKRWSQLLVLSRDTLVRRKEPDPVYQAMNVIESKVTKLVYTGNGE